jgi:hypothetical protein
MNNNRALINKYRRGMNQSMHNMSGSGQLANSPNKQPQRQAGWNANGNSTGGQTAPQYILTISNASAQNVSAFDVFGASQYLSGNYGGGTWNADGSFTINGVTIRSGYTNVSYQQILTSVSYKPVTIGSVYLNSIAGSNAQVTDAYQVTSLTAGGEKYESNIVPILDGYQFQSGITYNNNSFIIEPLTKLTWSTIYASAQFQLRFFTANIVDASNALSGTAVQNSFGKPRVIGSLS